MRRLKENNKSINQDNQKIIVSIIKKTFFIIEKYLYEIDYSYFNKIFKQLFMNIFHCLKMFSKNDYIMDDVLDSFFQIIFAYKNTMLSIKDNNLIELKLSFLNGFIDFLLTPEFYDFSNSTNLIKLFVKLLAYFDFGNIKEFPIFTNSHIFYKLLNFAPHLNNYFETEEEEEEDDDRKEKIQSDSINLQNKSLIAVYYFEILKHFFAKNSVKNDNFVNLKYIFHFIMDNLDTNYEICLVFFKFINDILGDNPDLYFSDNINIEQIKMLFSFILRISNNNIEIKLNIENILKNRKKIIYKIIEIIMKILFTKKILINKNSDILKLFKDVLSEIDITTDLIDTIIKGIEKILDNLIGAKKGNIGVKEKIEKIDSINNDSDVLNKFYSTIFNLISFFFNYSFDKNNISNIKDLNSYNDKILELLNFIYLKIRGNFQNLFNPDGVYCLIYLVKFYNNILFKKLYPEKYITQFIEVCELCKKYYLINSNILVKLDDNCYKIMLEIILDVCLNYIILSSQHFYKPLSFEQINGVRKDDIIKEQELLYNFLKDLFPKIGKNDKKNLNTIFYKSDHLNFLTEKAEKEKKKKSRRDSSIENDKNFYYYKKIYNFLIKENKKFELNHSTFFLIKLMGYEEILTNIDSEIGRVCREMKEILKYNNIALLILETINNLKEDLKILYKDKEFLKLKKKYSHGSEYYEEVNKRIIKDLKQSNFLSLDKTQNYIQKNILENIKENFNFYEIINSGKFCRCLDKNDSNKKTEDPKNLNNPKIKNEKNDSLTNSINSENNNISSKNENNNSDLKHDNSKNSNIINNSEEKPNSLDEYKSSSVQDKYSFKDDSSFKDISSPKEESILNLVESEENSEFVLEEKSSSSEIENKAPGSIPIYQSSKIVRSTIKRKTLGEERKEVFKTSIIKINNTRRKSEIMNRLFEKNKNIFSKKFDKDYIFNDEEEEKDSFYINFFEKPDIWFLKNSKKELMVNIFSVYFSDVFFNNNNFKIMKKYYLQNLVGVNILNKLLNFPSKLKNFTNGLEPFIFLKPYQSIFNDKLFPVSHQYFCDYITKNKKKIKNNQIILYKKIFQEFNLEDKFEEKCELIKLNKNYYGKIIGSSSQNFFIFEEIKFEFYEEDKVKHNLQDLNDLFTLSVVSKQPKSKSQLKRLEEIKNNNIFAERKKENKYVIIIFEEIDEIIEKRFLLMWQAIEIFLKNGKSYFFNFITHQNCQNVLNFFKNNSITKDKIHEKDFIKKEQTIKNEWINERLNTYDYLLYINKYGSRTFHDTNQYPIFPWLYKITEENKKEFRDLKYPMAAQNEINKEMAMKRYSEDAECKSEFCSHFGAHYSTSAYVYFYLMRIEPFTSLLIKLQGYKQEVPERMFANEDEILLILNSGRDNRELIPEVFNNIEIYLNLNCSDFGKRHKDRIDDFFLSDKNDNSETCKNIINFKYNSKISDYVEFVIKNKRELNDKKISNKINNWIDIIFGVKQLPESNKNRRKSLNIFYYESYEQNLNLFEIMKNLIKEGRKNKEIINEILSKINLIISFGQTPYQIFNESHPEIGINNSNYNNKEGDFEFDLNSYTWDKEIKLEIKINPLFFVINSNTGKIFIIDKERRLEIIENSLYSGKKEGSYEFSKNYSIQLPYMKFKKKIKINKENEETLYYYIFKEKYCISSFEDKIDFNLSRNILSSKDVNKNVKEEEEKCVYNNDNNDFNLYFNNYMKILKNEENQKKEKKKKKKEEDDIKFITCRHLDNSFKIYILTKYNAKKDYKPLSFVCEDFVSSCCTISYNKFVIGLKNGKLLQFSIEKDPLLSNKTNKNNIKIKFISQIKAHLGEINMIEIDKRLGVIITAGTDNFLYIRKLYDFELLTPIKLKEKYIITSAKISPYNLLYILCFNKKKEKSCILGYTLNGLYFAKSDYAFHDTLDFTKNGNIITFVDKTRLILLNPHDLKEKKNFGVDDEKKLREFNYKINKIYNSTWINFDFFSKNNETNTKIITYVKKENKNNVIKTLDLSNF